MKRDKEINPAWLVIGFILSMIITGAIDRYDKTAAAEHSKKCQHSQRGTTL
jgi:hypothetical protein